MLKEKIEQALEGLKTNHPKSAEDLEAFRLKYLSKKGLISGFYAELKSVAKEEKGKYGVLINKLKIESQEKFDAWKSTLGSDKGSKSVQTIDFDLPAPIQSQGSQHPLSLIREELIDLFGGIGFGVAEGEEVVTEWTNFSALNMPESHPARDMQDTFFVKNLPDHVLRTHTSGVQIQEMLKGELPIRTIAPGMVFRKDNDATHSPFFHQVEGLFLSEKVSFKDLKQTLFYFVKEFFGEQTKFRLRPSYFPFTEPSAEMDIEWVRDGKSGWMEILGCGMVDPAVLENAGIDSKKFSGFAFGIGIERLAMLRYGIQDIRVFFENDLRFLKQFASV